MHSSVRQVVLGRKLFDFYVDSVNGNDANNGRGVNSAFQTLAAASAVMANSSRVGLARGSTWREELNKGSLTDVKIGAYGSGAAPIIDCANIVTGWVAGAQANVWKATIALPTLTGGAHVNVMEDDVLLNGVASEVLCSGDQGSRYVTAHTGTIDVYIHCSDSGNPNSNGKQYKVGSREFAIKLGARATVTGIETKNNLANDGSIVLGDNSLIDSCVVRNGGKHNCLAGFGSTIRNSQILEAHNSVENGIQIVIYSATAPSGTVNSYITGNTFKQRGLLASPSNISGTYCHTSSGTVTGGLYVTGNDFIDCFGAVTAGTANTTVGCVFNGNYVGLSQNFTTMPYNFFSPYIQANSATGNKVFFPEPWATTFTATGRLFAADWTVTFDSNEFQTGPYFTYILAATAGSPIITARNNKGLSLGASFIRSSAAATTLTDVSGNVVGVSFPVECFNTVTVTLCNNNGWPSASLFRAGASYRTWAQWVSDGRDVNSTGSGDNKIALRDRNVSAAGDLRDWAPYLWINAENAASITQAGGFASAVADLGHGSRNLALLQPTPGTDKVQVVSAGGKTWFDGIASGGLRYAANDVSAQMHVLAVVVRPTQVLSAANLLGTVFSASTNDQLSFRLGVVGAAWTNEIVVASQGGANGVYYAHASQAWAADTPHLVVVYFDPITDTAICRIDGVLVGTMTALSRITQAPVTSVKGEPLTILRGNNTANAFTGLIGEAFLAGGPTSLDAVAEIETQMMARWGIV